MKKHKSENLAEEIKQSATYEFKKRQYIVTPHFNEDGKDTLAVIILKMMKNDIENNRL